MSNKPQLGNARLQIQGYMDNGQNVDMAVSAWINEPMEMKDDPAALAAIQQIHQIMLQHRLKVNIQIKARRGDDAREWPKIGSWNLFPNDRDQAQQPVQQYQQPQQQPPQQQWQQQPAPQQQPWQQQAPQSQPWQR